MIDIDEEVPEVQAPELPAVKSLACIAIREGIARYGTTIGRRGCKAIGRNWERLFAHSQKCRERVMDRILEDGGVDGRVRVAIRNVLEEDGEVDDSDESLAEAMEAELKSLLCVAVGAKRRGRAHVTTKQQIIEEKRAQTLLQEKMHRGIGSQVWGQCQSLMNQNDNISCILEGAFQMNPQQGTLLQNEVDR